MQREVTREQQLLDESGRIIEEGWARRPVWTYDRSKVKGGLLRIKEWDYYAVINQTKGYAITATVSDLGYAGLLALSYIDFNRRQVAQTDALAVLPIGTIGLSATSTEESQVSWANKKLRIALIKRGPERHVMIGCPTLKLPDGKVGLEADLTLVQQPQAESLNIATSWKENRKAFYLNEKVNCLEVSGTVRRGMETEQIATGEVWGVLDWGRGRWTYQNTWYWASVSSTVENVPFGLNLGYGFSDRTPASENAILYNHKLHKLDEVTFLFDRGDYMKNWTITDTEGRLDLTFEPCVDRASHMDYWVIKSEQHQIFGYFSGTCTLDDGSILTLSSIPGFAEEVFNRW